MAQKVQNLPAMQETWVQSLGREDPLEKGMATHFSILAWRIPRTEEAGPGYCPWGCKSQTPRVPPLDAAMGWEMEQKQGETERGEKQAHVHPVPSAVDCGARRPEP